MVDTGRLTRRAALGLIGGGAFTLAAETFGFTNIEASRVTNVDVADDSSALVGLLISDQVRKNNRELLANVTNNTGHDLSVTFSLVDPAQGTLYAPDGSTGDSVTFSLAADATRAVDIEAAVGGETVPFEIDADAAGFSFRATRETEAVAGNNPGAVNVKHAKKFVARADENDWIFDNKVTVEFLDHFGDRVEYEVTDPSGTVVGTLTHGVGDATTYERQGTGNTPAVRIDPVDGYQVRSGTEYQVTVTGWDVQDNFDSETRTDTA